MLLVNTHSRRGQELFKSASERLRELKVPLKDSVEFDDFPNLLKRAKEEVDKGTPLLLVGGGDGSVNAMANVTAGTQTALGILPFGTGNAFARDLGILDVEQACEAIANGRVARVDIGSANEKAFVNVATVGLTTEIAKSLQESLKRKYGRFVYVYAVLTALRHIKPFHVNLETDNGQIDFMTLQVVVGNGRYHAGPFKVAPDAGITTGKLSVYALESASKAALLKLAIHLPRGDHVTLPEVHSESILRGVLSTTPVKTSIVDGEPGPKTPINFCVHPHGLKVIVPEDFTG
ncbi:MAG TPA: YegS/Rv2252/BmrU family lipid kinase [Fimbriimonas sp.]|nr:YegS/Rv2252/BmrU family lipid kinase [Fimbriimonas sp.]